MEKKKTLLVVLALALLLAVAYPLYNRLSRDAQPDQLITLPQQESSMETQNTQPTETGPEGTRPTNPPVTLEYDFTVIDGSGNPVKLSDYVGKPIVLNFWASWCGPCKNEMPEFQQVFEEMGEQVQFLMVNATVSGDTVEKAKSFVGQSGYTFPVLFDTRGDALYTYGVDAFPTTFFLDKTGTVASYVVGAISRETLLKGIGMVTK
jgi:thiol-disulfide isomerase/thioredoxin